MAAKTLKNIFCDLESLSKDYKDEFYYLSYMWSPIKKIKSQKRMQALMRLKPDCDEILEKIYEIAGRYVDAKQSIFVELNPNNLG